MAIPKRILTAASLAAFFISILISVQTFAGQGATGIIAGIAKAPVIRDGNVQDQPFDYVITLDRSLNPNVPGRSLAAGDTIKIHFPDAWDFSDLGDYPVASPGSSSDCVPGNLVCSAAVLLQGWPQNPIGPPNYSLSVEGNTFVYTAINDIMPNGSGAPGIKQMHLILNGLTNPKPGHYRIRVEAQTGPGGSVETGSVLVHVLPKDRPSINVTSVFNPPQPFPNTIYQEADTNAMAPLVWSFLLWGKNGVPLDDVWLNWTDADEAELRQDGKTVGHLYIDAPSGAGGQDGYVVDATGLPAAPVIGSTPGIGPQPVGLLQLQFMTGSEPGDYVTTLMLNGGNAVQMTVTATP